MSNASRFGSIVSFVGDMDHTFHKIFIFDNGFLPTGVENSVQNTKSLNINKIKCFSDRIKYNWKIEAEKSQQESCTYLLVFNISSI